LLVTIGESLFGLRQQKSGMNLNDLMGALFGGGGAGGAGMAID
jgi:hypothetical protein